MDGCKSSKLGGMILRLTLLLSLGAVLAGCHFGRLSMSMRDFHGVPVPSIQSVPQQWEPELQEE